MSNIPTPFSTNHLALCLLLMMTTFIERERKKPCHRHPRRVRRPSVLLDGSSSSSKLTFKFLVLSSFFKRPVYQGRWSRSRSSSSSSSIRIIEVHNYFSFFSLSFSFLLRLLCSSRSCTASASSALSKRNEFVYVSSKLDGGALSTTTAKKTTLLFSDGLDLN